MESSSSSSPDSSEDGGDKLMRDVSADASCSSRAAVVCSASSAEAAEESESKEAATAFLSDSLLPIATTRVAATIDSMIVWKATWHKQLWPVYWAPETVVGDIKEQLEAQTDVRKEKMTLVGLKLKKKHRAVALICDDTPMCYLTCVKKKKRFIMIGTVDSDTFIDDALEGAEAAYILDDESWAILEENPREIQRRHTANLAKLKQTIESTTVNVMNAPRRGKKLLVLDIDYTLFDMGSKHEEDWDKLKRPFTDYLLEKCYANYDIVIWSQTSWKWIEIKLTEMSMLLRSDYRFSFVLDKKAMFTIYSMADVASDKSTFDSRKKKRKRKKDKKVRHYVKALEVIWAKFPEHYNEHNTIHVDDLARNFALNPHCGLKCVAYRNSDFTKHTDNELLYITEYLTLIAKRPDFKGLNHKKWVEYVSRHSTSALPPPRFGK